MLPRPAEIALETLPSWPAVQDPSVLHALLVMAFIPLGVAGVLVAVIMGPHWARHSRTD